MVSRSSDVWGEWRGDPGFRLAHCSAFRASGHRSSVSETNLPAKQNGTCVTVADFCWTPTEKNKLLGGSRDPWCTRMESPNPEGRLAGVAPRAPDTRTGRSPPSSREEERGKILRGLAGVRGCWGGELFGSSARLRRQSRLENASSFFWGEGRKGRLFLLPPLPQNLTSKYYYSYCISSDVTGWKYCFGGFFL